MAVIKCKMCGGDLILVEGSTVATCEFCGTTQTVPSQDNEKKLTLFARANRLRAACDFDKAAGIYESIVADFPDEAEAYWGLVLCKYGIEYVDDPGTGKKIPTCHRSSFDSVMEDTDLDQALENATPAARKVYRAEAKLIDQIRKGIISVSANEDPYDIFICYKETDENGQRTLDSVLAQDIYDALTDKGYRVFFARISLEDKLGQEYEPYIFGALNSAKIMLAVGTDYEYFNAVWVKNEWSRFLKLMTADKSKHLIPCYKGIDAYDMPKEFARLQAQDLGKVGATQDLLRGIEKLLPKQKRSAPVQEPVVVSGPGVDSLMRRAQLYMDNAEWNEAAETYDKVLDISVENVDAHIGLLCAKRSVSNRKALANCVDAHMAEDTSFRNAVRFAKPAVRKELEDCALSAQKNALYIEAKAAMEQAKQEADYRNAAVLFNHLGNFKDAAKLSAECTATANRIAEKNRAAEAEKRRLEQERLEKLYQEATKLRDSAKTAAAMSIAAKKLDELGTYKNAQLMAATAKATAERMRADEQLETAQAAKDAEERHKAARIKALRNKRKRKYRTLFITVGIVVALVLGYTISNYIEDRNIAERIYTNGISAMENGNYDEAVRCFNSVTQYTHISGFEDTQDLLIECIYKQSREKLFDGDLDAAKNALSLLPYFDAEERNSFFYGAAEELMAAGDPSTARAVFGFLSDYRDSSERYVEAEYMLADKMFNEGNFRGAAINFRSLSGYLDADERLIESNYQYAITLCNGSVIDRNDAVEMFTELGEYKDCANYLLYCQARELAEDDLFDAEDLLRQLPEEMLDVKTLLGYIDAYKKWDKIYVCNDYYGQIVKEDFSVESWSVDREFGSAKLVFNYQYSGIAEANVLDFVVYVWSNRDASGEEQARFGHSDDVDITVLDQEEVYYTLGNFSGEWRDFYFSDDQFIMNEYSNHGDVYVKTHVFTS